MTQEGLEGDVVWEGPGGPQGWMLPRGSPLVAITGLKRVFLVASVVKNQPANAETRVQSLGWKILWRRKWQPTPGFLPQKGHGQRSPVGYSTWGRKETRLSN